MDTKSLIAGMGENYKAKQEFNKLNSHKPTGLFEGDNLLNQIVNISKAAAYDVTVENVKALQEEIERLKKPKYYLFGQAICSVYFSHDFVDLCLWMQEPGNARDWQTFEFTGDSEALLIEYDGWNGFAEITKEEYDSLNMVIEALD